MCCVVTHWQSLLLVEHHDARNYHRSSNLGIIFGNFQEEIFGQVVSGSLQTGVHRHEKR